MVSCAEFAEYISAHLDGELSPEDEEKLKSHLADCHLCASLYASLADFEEQLSDSMAEPPAELLSGVMSGIQLAEAPKATPIVEVKKRPKHRGRIAAGLAALAACAALAVFAVPEVLDRPTDVSGSAGTAGDVIARSDTEPQTGYGITFNADNGSEADASSDTSSPMAAGETDGNPVGFGMPSDGMEYYAVITVTGELPELLEEYEMFEKADGTFEIYVYDLDTVTELESLGYEVEYDSETQSELSLVVYIP